MRMRSLLKLPLKNKKFKNLQQQQMIQFNVNNWYFDSEIMWKSPLKNEKFKNLQQQQMIQFNVNNWYFDSEIMWKSPLKNEKFKNLYNLMLITSTFDSEIKRNIFDCICRKPCHCEILEIRTLSPAVPTG